jgi:hypothetical protein
MVRTGRGYPMTRVIKAPPVFFAAFDATGGGAAVDASSASWSHTAAAGADVFVFAATEGSTYGVSTVKYNGTSMTDLGSAALDGSTYGALSLWHLAGAGTGSSETVDVTLSGSTYLTANSVSYTNVSSVGSLTTADGYGTSLSQTGPTLTGGQLALHAFAAYGTPASMSYSGGTERWYSAGYSSDLSMVISDSSVSATSFTATETGGVSLAWAGIAVPLSG